MEVLEASGVNDGLQIALSNLSEVHIVELEVILEESMSSSFFPNKRGAKFTQFSSQKTMAEWF